jgi:nucleotide-binding universal stress UspA family protein
MTFKSILVQVSPLERHADRLRVAAELARRFEATLVGVGVEGIPPLINAGLNGVAAAAWTREMSETIGQDLRAARAAFEQAVGGCPAEWSETRGAPAQVLIANAALGDLIVVGGDSPNEIDNLRGVDCGAVVVGAGRPVLRVPSGHAHLKAEHVLIAWKNTREARRALADALPLLKLAGDIALLVVSDPAGRDEQTAEAEAVAATLRRHELPVRVVWAEKAGAATSAVILERARRIGADLIVCGGYGHSRLGEWAFGGVTRDLMRQDERFVLFSH